MNIRPYLQIFLFILFSVLDNIINEKSNTLFDVTTFFLISSIIVNISKIFNLSLKNNYYISVLESINYYGYIFVATVILFFKLFEFSYLSVIYLIIGIVLLFPIALIFDNFIYSTKKNINYDYIKTAFTSNKYLLEDYVYENDVRYSIQYNKDKKQIILTIGGTDIKNKNNVLKNIDINGVNYNPNEITDIDLKNRLKGVFVHEGYYKSYISIKNNIFSKINNFVKDGADNMIITGYSLGGGIATIAGFDIYGNSNLLKLDRNNINIINIGSPSVGSSEFNQIYKELNAIFIEHLNDPVPKLLIWKNNKIYSNMMLYSNDFLLNAHTLDAYEKGIFNPLSTYNYIYKNRYLYGIYLLAGMILYK